MKRRDFLLSAAAASLAGSFLPSRLRAAAGRTPLILLRSSWQSVNIGDIGHTPGALSVLNKYFPEAEITLWPGDLGHGSREMLTKGYPQLKIVEGSLKDGKPNTPALAKVWEKADLYLSGSGSGFPASEHAVAFQKATGKPVGVFGVSTDPISGIGAGRDAEGGTLATLRERALQLPPTRLSPDLRHLIDRAAFFFCRDTISRDYLRAQGVKCPILEFGTDAQLGMHLRDDTKGLAYLKAQNLKEEKFICVIPRLRYTPYYRIRANAKRTPDDDIKDAINNRTTEQDHAKLREMIVAYVRNTGNKVLTCPEMTYQVELAKEVLVDPLPDDVKKNVIWRDTFWLPDEAASVYAKAEAVVSIECHSPLIALHNGTPTFYVRQPTDTCKGQMYRDIGADDWFFEIDETSGQQLWSRLATIHADPAKARARVKTIMAGVQQIQRRMVAAVRRRESLNIMRRLRNAVMGAVAAAAVAGHLPAAQDRAQGELLYYTGFENGARIVSIDPSNPAANDDLIEGEGSQKASEIRGLKFHYEGGDPSMRFARIVAENGNPSNRVVRFWVNQANAKNFSKTRIQADVKSVPAGLREFYQTVRLYLPEDMALLKCYPSEITWLTIMEVWNNAPLKPFPFRVTVGLHKPVRDSGQLCFFAHSQDIDQSNPKKAKFTTIWSSLNQQFKVPFGKWMTLEYYIVEGDKTKGRFFMAVTPEGGQKTVLFDITNFTHHTMDPAPDGFSHWNPIKLYTSRQLVDYMRGQSKALEAYWDDIFIWKDRRP